MFGVEVSLGANSKLLNNQVHSCDDDTGVACVHAGGGSEIAGNSVEVQHSEGPAIGIQLIGNDGLVTRNNVTGQLYSALRRIGRHWNCHCR